MRDDLVLGFLYLHQLSELGRLAGLALANDLAVWFKQGSRSFPATASCRRRHAPWSASPPAVPGPPSPQLFARPPSPPLLSRGHLVYFRHHAFGVVQNLARVTQQLLILLLSLCLPFRSLCAGSPSQSQSRACSRFASGSALCASVCPRLLFDLLHRSRQHARPVSQQAGIGWVMDVGFHHRRVHTHFASTDHAFFLRDLHQPAMQFRDYFSAQRLSRFAPVSSRPALCPYRFARSPDTPDSCALPAPACRNSSSARVSAATTATPSRQESVSGLASGSFRAAFPVPRTRGLSVRHHSSKRSASTIHGSHNEPNIFVNHPFPERPLSLFASGHAPL